MNDKREVCQAEYDAIKARRGLDDIDMAKLGYVLRPTFAAEGRKA